MTAWRRLRDRYQAGVWQRLHENLLAELNVADALGWLRAVIHNGGSAKDTVSHWRHRSPAGTVTTSLS